MIQLANANRVIISPHLSPNTHMHTHLSSILTASPVSHLTSSSHFDGSVPLCLRCCPSKMSSYVGISQCRTVWCYAQLFICCLPKKAGLRGTLFFLLPLPMVNQEEAIQKECCYIKTHLYTNTHCLHFTSLETVPEFPSVLVLYISNYLLCIPIQNPLFSPFVIIIFS